MSLTKAIPQQIRTLADLREQLQEIPCPLSANELVDLVCRVDLADHEWRTTAAFDKHGFCSQPVYNSACFEVNLIGWLSGQQSSVHDHRGTACCILVLQGVLTNLDFHRTAEGRLLQTGHTKFHAGQILSRDDRSIHSCGNLQAAGTELVTLHFYSPPLLPLSQRQHPKP